LKRSHILIIVLAVACTVLLGWRLFVVGTSLWGMSDEEQLARAERAAAAARESARSRAVTNASAPRSVSPSSATRIQALYAKGGDPRQVAREAALSDDPLIWLRSQDLNRLCLNAKFGKAIGAEEFRAAFAGRTEYQDPAKINELVEFSRRMREAPARRLMPGANWTRAVLAWAANKSETPESEMGKLSEAAMGAPESATERAARDRLVERMRAFCQSEPDAGSSFFDEFRRARDRWIAQGATGAMLQEKSAGWTSTSLDALNDRDYALVERIVRERQPDGLAKLLSGSNAWRLNLVSESGGNDLTMGLAKINVSRLVAVVASCELAVDTCSADSPAFIETCVSYGGCHLTDVPSLVRYVLARDGLDPAWIERESTRVVKAVWDGDLDALGVRRKTP
jgi:hypothetical protein